MSEETLGLVLFLGATFLFIPAFWAVATGKFNRARKVEKK